MMPTLATVTTIVCLVMDCKEETTQTASTGTTSTIAATTEEINTEVTIPTRSYARHVVLDTNGIYHLYWQPPEDRNPDSEICFKVEVNRTGYFGLGFSPNGGMPGSDIVTGWIRDGIVFFQDRHATAFSLPPKDAQHDYKLLNAFENDTFTVFEFCRKLDTCDEDDMVIEETTMRIIYAYSERDPDGDDPFYHGPNRGSKSIMLLQKDAQGLDLDSMQYWDIMTPDVDISNHTTLYWCKIYKSPEVSEKQHIVYVKPEIQDEHVTFIHHALIYECIGGTADQFEDLVDDPGTECFTPQMPIRVLDCRGIFVGYAVGGQGTILPDHVGLPMFPGPSKYYMMEIHLDNPFRRSAIVGNSGLRFYYTDKLREFDGGNFMVGASVFPRVFIPPGQKEYVVVGHTINECLGSSFPEDGVNIVAICPHSHLLGRSFKVRHFRGNEELEPLNVDKYYDFNYQDYQYYTEERKFLPKDQITVECTYDSSQRTSATYGGQSTQEEMCLSFLLYYPLVDQYRSYSAPTLETINKALNTNITEERDVYRELGNYDWSSVDIKEVEHAMRYSEHQTQCDYGPFPEGLPMVSYPDDLIPYEEESSCDTTVP